LCSLCVQQVLPCCVTGVKKYSFCGWRYCNGYVAVFT
jgi:hypothetical protein